MKKIYIFSAVIFLLVILFDLSSCKHDLNDIILNPKDTTNIKSPTPTPTPGLSNSKDSVCFDDEILPILFSSCAKSGCHDDTTRQSNIILNNYQNVTSTISGNLLLQVIQDQGPLGMPVSPNPKLTNTQINTIKKWVDQGMKSGIDCLGPCDTTNITFSGTINPLIQNSCIGCHGAGGSLPDLTNYNNVKSVVDNNGKFYCVINHESGCSPMPKNSNKLSNCKVLQIKKWIDAGAPNN